MIQGINNFILEEMKITERSNIILKKILDKTNGVLLVRCRQEENIWAALYSTITFMQLEVAMIVWNYHQPNDIIHTQIHGAPLLQ